jgi:hypothetical protein
VFIRFSILHNLLQISTIQGAFSRFEYATKSEETMRKYVRRLELFFDFYKIEGKTIQEKSDNFLLITKNGKANQKIRDMILIYMHFHIKRA